MVFLSVYVDDIKMAAREQKNDETCRSWRANIIS